MPAAEPYNPPTMQLLTPVGLGRDASERLAASPLNFADTLRPNSKRPVRQVKGPLFLFRCQYTCQMETGALVLRSIFDSSKKKEKGEEKPGMKQEVKRTRRK